MVESLVQGILEYNQDKDSASRRRKWCLAAIHTRDELAEHVRRQLVRSGVSFPDEFISGREHIESHEASLWEAWFGIHPGLGGIGADKVNWGDVVEDYSFGSEWDAKRFAESLDKNAIATGYYLGSDGLWHVNIVHDNPYN